MFVMGLHIGTELEEAMLVVVNVLANDKLPGTQNTGNATRRRETVQPENHGPNHFSGHSGRDLYKR